MSCTIALDELLAMIGIEPSESSFNLGPVHPSVRTSSV